MISSKHIAGIIAVLAFLWIISGLIFPSSSKKEASNPQKTALAEQDNSKNSALMEVRIKKSQAEEFSDEVIVTGRTQASKKVSLRAETSGQISEILKEKGSFATLDDSLAKIEVRDREAKLSEAKERVNQRQIEYNAAKSLAGKGFNSKVRLAQSKADLEDAKAKLTEAEIELSKIHIKSPFDGVVFEQNIEVGDYVSQGDEIFTIVNLNPIELVGFLSERNIGNLKIGDKAYAEFLNGGLIEGEISYIAPAANEQTRTFQVEISAPNNLMSIKDGLTATMRIPVEAKLAHKISPSVLSLNDAGEIGVKIVNEQDIVEFKPIVILSDRPDHMWIYGLPGKVRLITVGQDFVSNGQKVKPVLSKNKGLL